MYCKYRTTLNVYFSLYLSFLHACFLHWNALSREFTISSNFCAVFFTTNPNQSYHKGTTFAHTNFLLDRYWSCKYYDDSVTVFDCLLRILEEMAVVVFAEQRGEDVLKKLLQVAHSISLYQYCRSGSVSGFNGVPGKNPDPDPGGQKLPTKSEKKLINFISFHFMCCSLLMTENFSCSLDVL